VIKKSRREGKKNLGKKGAVKKNRGVVWKMGSGRKISFCKKAHEGRKPPINTKVMASLKDKD